MNLKNNLYLTRVHTHPPTFGRHDVQTCNIKHNVQLNNQAGMHGHYKYLICFFLSVFIFNGLRAKLSTAGIRFEGSPNLTTILAVNSKTAKS